MRDNNQSSATYYLMDYYHLVEHQQLYLFIFLCITCKWQREQFNVLCIYYNHREWTLFAVTMQSLSHTVLCVRVFIYRVKGCLAIAKRDVKCIVPKGPYLPCVSMAGRALLAGYLRYVCCLTYVCMEKICAPRGVFAFRKPYVILQSCAILWFTNVY